jgi:hypothetical protein
MRKCIFYTSPDIIWLIKGRQEERGRHWTDEKSRNVLVMKFEGRGKHRRPRCVWKDDVKMDLKDIGG